MIEINVSAVFYGNHYTDIDTEDFLRFSTYDGRKTIDGVKVKSGISSFPAVSNCKVQYPGKYFTTTNNKLKSSRFSRSGVHLVVVWSGSVVSSNEPAKQCRRQ